MENISGEILLKHQFSMATDCMIRYNVDHSAKKLVIHTNFFDSCLISDFIENYFCNLIGIDLIHDESRNPRSTPDYQIEMHISGTKYQTKIYRQRLISGNLRLNVVLKPSDNFKP